MKTCTKCEDSEPHIQFYRKNDSWCKTCKNKATTRWSKKDPEKSRATIKRSAIKKSAEIKKLVGDLKSVPCADCDKSYPPYVMDFDHIPDRGQKLGNIATMWSCGKDTILAEIAKCDVVCSNCHRIRTHNRLQEKT